MNFRYILLAIVAVGLLLCTFLILFLSRYVKVGPNEVLIVSGRRRQLPDGTSVGFRFVKGGGTFVFPIIEKAERLSLEVISIEMSKFRARTANGAPVQTDCVAQVKVKGDDASILAASEHFLGKSEGDMQSLLRPILEKHLRAILGNSSLEELEQDPGACADRVQEAVTADLGKMGLSVTNFTLQNVRAT